MDLFALVSPLLGAGLLVERFEGIGPERQSLL